MVNEKKDNNVESPFLRQISTLEESTKERATSISYGIKSLITITIANFQSAYDDLSYISKLYKYFTYEDWISALAKFLDSTEQLYAIVRPYLESIKDSQTYKDVSALIDIYDKALPFVINDETIQYFQDDKLIFKIYKDMWMLLKASGLADITIEETII